MAFGLFELMFPVVFLLVFGIIMFNIVTGLGQWVKNNNSPRLSVEGNEYGLLVEGDRGRVTFQGTRYLGFHRMF